MALRPLIREWSGQLFRKQLNAALDWLESNGGGGGSGALIGLRMFTGATEPVDAQENDLWIPTTAAAGTGQIITIDDNPPASPNIGDLWIPTS